MTKETKPVEPVKKLEQPADGGSYTRNADGTLTKTHETLPRGEQTKESKE